MTYYKAVVKLRDKIRDISVQMFKKLRDRVMRKMSMFDIRQGYKDINVQGTEIDHILAIPMA